MKGEPSPLQRQVLSAISSVCFFRNVYTYVSINFCSSGLGLIFTYRGVSDNFVSTCPPLSSFIATSCSVVWASQTPVDDCLVFSVEALGQPHCPVLCVHLCGRPGSVLMDTPTGLEGCAAYIPQPLSTCSQATQPTVGHHQTDRKGVACHFNVLLLNSESRKYLFMWHLGACVSSLHCLCVACFSTVIFLVLLLICKILFGFQES